MPMNAKLPQWFKRQKDKLRADQDMPAKPQGEVVTVAAAAQMLDISEAEIMRLIDAGDIPATRAEGRIDIPLASLKRYRDQRDGRPPQELPK